MNHNQLLVAAARDGDVTVVKNMVERYNAEVSTGFPLFRDSEPWNEAHVLVLSSLPSSHHQQPSAHDADGTSALIHATLKGNTDVCEFLIRYRDSTCPRATTRFFGSNSPSLPSPSLPHIWQQTQSQGA